MGAITSWLNSCLSLHSPLSLAHERQFSFESGALAVLLNILFLIGDWSQEQVNLHIFKHTVRQTRFSRKLNKNEQHTPYKRKDPNPLPFLYMDYEGQILN